WPWSVSGNPTTGLCRLLLAARPIALAVAPAEARIGSSESPSTADATSRANEPAVGAADFTTGGSGAAEQASPGVDRTASGDRRHPEGTVSGLWGDAEAGLWVSRHPEQGQSEDVASLVGGSQENWNPFAGTHCPNCKAGPQCGAGCGNGELEQRAGGRSDQPPEGAEAADVRSSWRGTT